VKTKPRPNYSVVDRLLVEIHPDRAAMGHAAARAGAAYLRDVISLRGEARVIFSCAPSQDIFLATLVDPDACGVSFDWKKVTAFHMDEYVGLADEDPRSFRAYLKRHLLDHVQVGRFHPIPAEKPDLKAVCARYANLLIEKPIDIVFLGIGENGHIAFNDPGVADFDDPELVKDVELDLECRQQQVNDGCFGSLGDVPTRALTLTIPVFRQAMRLSVHVPGARKASAVRSALRDPVTPACPASILRLHPHAAAYFDVEAAKRL
jgi:glucosamine-6-phosphate deaminase